MLECDPQTFGLPFTPSARVLVLISGFPDKHDVWATVRHEFKTTHHIVSLVTPGYSASRRPLADEWGPTLDETIARLAAAIDAAIGKTRPFQLLVHDWGSYWGFCLAAKDGWVERVSHIASIDVGAAPVKEPALLSGETSTVTSTTRSTINKGVGWLLFYQLVFAAIFWIGVRISGSLAQLLLQIFLRLAPCVGPMQRSFDWTTLPRPASELHWWYCWPYYQMWFTILTRQRVPVPHFPAAPCFFAYGCKKRCMFHSESFAHSMEATVGNVIIEYPNCAHWLMQEQPVRLNKDLRSFFDGDGLPSALLELRVQISALKRRARKMAGKERAAKKHFKVTLNAGETEQSEVHAAAAVRDGRIAQQLRGMATRGEQLLEAVKRGEAQEEVQSYYAHIIKQLGAIVS